MHRNSSEISSFLILLCLLPVAGREGSNSGVEDGGCMSDNVVAELLFIGATLHLRGAEPVVQPLGSASGNVLVYNGNNALGLASVS